tara:strand:+ start:188 stop:388 length:201 start_codon:yes stop_codon:yes gene_type:complete
MAKKKTRRKKKAPSEITRGGEKWRVTGLQANLKSFLSKSKHLTERESASLESIYIQFSSLLSNWQD